MNLYRLSLLSIVACLAGLAALMIATVESIVEIRENNAVESQLLQLHDRIDVFNASSDRMLLLGADPAQWRTYQTEAAAIHEALEQLGKQSPAAVVAARRIQSMAAALNSALGPALEAAGPDSDREAAASGQALEPLDLPEASRGIMEQMIGQGMVLDAAFSEALHVHQSAIAREATRIPVMLGGAALLFGLVCLLFFGLMHRRLVRPARALAETLDDIRAGNSQRRAPVATSDELARVSHTLNALLDEQQAADRSMREK